MARSAGACRCSTSTPDKPLVANDPMRDGAQIEYTKYFPSMFGEITLWIEPTLHEKETAELEKRLAQIESIDKVVVTFHIAQARSANIQS